MRRRARRLIALVGHAVVAYLVARAIEQRFRDALELQRRGERLIRDMARLGIGVGR